MLKKLTFSAELVFPMSLRTHWVLFTEVCFIYMNVNMCVLRAGVSRTVKMFCMKNWLMQTFWSFHGKLKKVNVLMKLLWCYVSSLHQFIINVLNRRTSEITQPKQTFSFIMMFEYNNIRKHHTSRCVHYIDTALFEYCIQITHLLCVYVFVLLSLWGPL